MEGNQPEAEGKYLELSQIIENVNGPRSLNNVVEDRVIQILNSHGTWILKKDPNIFKNIIEKARYMIESDRYISIIQKTAALHEPIPDKPTVGPLGCLVTLMEDHTEELCAHQNNLLNLVKILADVDDNIHSATKCLWVLTINSKYSFHINNTLEWTEEFLSTMKFLLEKGADPTWAPSKVLQMEREHRFTAQLKFFLSGKFVLVYKNHLFSQLMDVSTMFLSQKQCNHEQLWGTVLHALVHINWQWFMQRLNHLPVDFFQQLHQIISKVIECNPALIDITDFNGNTPLQCFISHVIPHKHNLEDVRDIVFLLKSENNINNRNNTGRTVVHCLAEAFSIFDEPVFPDRQAAFLDLTQCLTSDSNTDIQEINGQTALHLLTENYSKNIKDHSLNMFWENFKRLVTRSNINVQDNQGYTVLHILMRKVFQDPVLGEHILPHLQPITTTQNVNAQDKHSVTPYSWILRGKLGHQKNDLVAGRVFSEIEEIFIRNGGSAVLARNGFPFIWYFQLKDVINSINKPDDTDSDKEEKILEILQTEGTAILTVDPHIFLRLVEKAYCMIQSKNYLTIIQVMASVYATAPIKFETGLLENLMTQIEKYPENFMARDDEVSLLVQTLSNAEECANSKLSQLELIIGGMVGPEYLDCVKEDRILQILDGDGTLILQENPELATNLVKRAYFMIASDKYTRVLQKMADAYMQIPNKLQEGPLDCLMQQMEDEETMRSFIKNQGKFLSLVKILTPTEISVQAWSKCLWVLIWKSEYVKSLASEESESDEFLRTFKLLLEKGADPTWIPKEQLETRERKGRYSAQCGFFSAIKYVLRYKNHLLNSLMEVMPLFLSPKGLTNDHLHGTSLHYLVALDWEWLIGEIEHLPDDFFQLYKEVISKLIKHDPAIVDMTNSDEDAPLQWFIDGMKLQEDILENVRDIVCLLRSDKNIANTNTEGKTYLHYLAESFPIFLKPVSQNGHETFFDLVKNLISDSSVDVQDKNGQTALHILAGKYSKDIPQHNFSIYWELVKRLLTEPNINAQDKKGFTVLHIFMRKVLWEPDLGKQILPHLQTIASSENVNAQDKHSVTPYSWILRRKLGHRENVSNAGEIYSEIEEMLIRKGANADLARTGFPFIQDLQVAELTNIIEKLWLERDVDQQGKSILELLAEVGTEIVKGDPEVFLKMIRKAGILIKSTLCCEIIQKMADAYKSIPNKLQEGPLDCLVQQMEDEETMRSFIKNQGRFLSLVKIVTAACPHTPRSKCLRLLIMNAEYTSGRRRDNFQWTDELIATLTLLLNEGAYPTWIPEGQDESALYKFLQGLFLILSNGSQLSSALTDFLQLLLTLKCLNHKEPKGTVLHALLSCHWKDLPKKVPADFSEQCHRIVSMVVEYKPTLLDMIDEHGRTPLHILSEGISEHPDAADKLLPFFPSLTTPENVNAGDKNSVTPLFWILVGKERWETDPSTKMTFSDLEEIFIHKGADAHLARIGAAEPVLKWIEQEFGAEEWTQEKLEKLLSLTKTVINWESHSYKMKLNDTAKKNLWRLGNPRFMGIVMDIVKIIVKNSHNAQHVWDAICPENYGVWLNVRLFVVEMLSVCAEGGAQPTDKQLKEILSLTRELTGSEEWTLSYLKILVSLSRKKRFTQDLNFLGEFHSVSEDRIHLGRKLVHSMYDKWEECLKSGKLINCFLFITNEREIFREEFIEESFKDMCLIRKDFIYGTFAYYNWMKRSPLHLAVIFLDSLKFLPPKIIEKYIDTKDVDGRTPLHVAKLHRNEQAIQFLLRFRNNENVVDRFGFTPQDLGSRASEPHPDVRHKEVCRGVIEANEGVLEKMKPMLVLSEKEAEDLSKELVELFERLVEKTKFKEIAKIQIGGSMREKLKSGRLDEGDVQICINGYSDGFCVYTAGGRWNLSQFCYEMKLNLIEALGKISWEGIDLRPVWVKGPWKLVREGNGSCKGMEVSLDVVAVFVDQKDERRYDLRFEITPKEAARCRGEMLEGDCLPLHKGMQYKILETWNFIKGFNLTYFGFEWNMIDCLPPSCRLAIVVSKAFVQAFDWCRGEKEHVKMPITSYTIKTALFYLTANWTGLLELDERYKEAEVLRNALDLVEGQVDRRNKLEFNPRPKWTSDEDLHQHGEEARVWACKIFSLIKHLSEEGWKLNNYWNRVKPVVKIIDNDRQFEKRTDIGEAEYVCDVCDCALDRLKENTFHDKYIVYHF